MSIELPKDAEGREIPLDTVALFNRVGNVYSIVRWTFTTDFDLSDGWSNKWRAITDRGFALDRHSCTSPRQTHGRSWKRTWAGAHAKLREMGYEFVNTLFTDEWYSDEAMEERGVVQVPLCFLAKSLENMSLCHAAYFCKGWENARGCRIEHDAAVAYGLEVLYED